MQSEAGTRLDQQVRERGALPPEKAAQIAEEVLAQIDLLAQRGEIRALSGISLSRILLSPNGQVVLLRPTDELPAVVSAPAYASPEEIRGDSPGVHSAIYSLGCALFELLTGRPPFLGKDPKAVLRAHLSSPAPDLTALRPDLPAALSAAVASFLAKDPARRPLDATHAIGLLRAALGREEDLMLPPSRPVQAPPGGARAGVHRPGRGPSPHRHPPGKLPLGDRGGSYGEGGRHSGRNGSPAGRAAGGPGRMAAGAAASRGASAAARRPGGPVVREPGARTGLHRSHGARGAGAPPPASWVFTWSGLGLGVALSVFFAAMTMMKSQTPPPASAERTQEEKEAMLARRAGFRKAAAEADELALREFRNLPARVSYGERVAKIKDLLDRFYHTRAAREMAEALTAIRAQAAEVAANPVRHEPEPDAAPAPAPAGGTAPPGETTGASPVDGIDLLPGPKDDGTTDL